MSPADSGAAVAHSSPTRSVDGPRPEVAPSGALPFGGWILATVTFLVLAFGLPVILVGVRGSSFEDPALGLSMFVTVYSAAHLAALLRSGRDAIVRLTFWVFVYLWLGLAASAQIISQRFPIPFQTFSQSAQVKGMVGIVVGMVAYDVGSVLGARSRASSSLGRRLQAVELAPRRVWGVAAIGILYPLYVTATSGLAVRFSSRETATNALFRPETGQRVDLIQNKANALIQSFLLWGPALLGLYLMLYLYRSQRAGAQAPDDVRWWCGSLRARRLIALLILTNVLANNPISNPRYRFAGAALALAVAFWPTGGMARFRTGAVGVLLLSVIVFPYAAVFRYDERQLTFTPLNELLATSPDYGMYQQQLNGFVYTREHGHSMGKQLAGAVFSPVPRVFWPGKPIDTGNLISRSTLINASSDLWAEANVDFGMPGIVVWLLAYGYLCRVFEDAYRDRDQGKASVIGAAVPLFAAFQVFLVRGALQPAFGELMPLAVVFVLCLRQTSSASLSAPASPAALDR